MNADNDIPSWRSSAKNGPRTVDSVAPSGFALLTESISVVTPKVSDRRMNSEHTN